MIKGLITNCGDQAFYLTETVLAAQPGRTPLSAVGSAALLPTCSPSLSGRLINEYRYAA
jgi:hypothetical protein